MKKKLAAVLAVICLLGGCKANDDIKEGTEFLQAGSYEEARERFWKAAEKEEQAAEAHRGIGLASYELREYGTARENLQKALELGAEETPVIYNMIGACSMNLDDYDGALSAYERGIACFLSQEDTDIDDVVLREMRLNQIICYEKKHDWEAAKTAAQEYVSAYPDDAALQKEMEFLKTR